MEEQLISFETAKLANKAGFNQNVTGSHIWNYYNEDGSHGMISCGHIHLDNPIMCSQSLLQKWLSEKYKLRVLIEHRNSSGALTWTIYKWNYDNDIGKWERINHITSFQEYEQALDKGLQEALKLILGNELTLKPTDNE